jgi:F0F1-type ATP synthase membrane subunit b/b'
MPAITILFAFLSLVLLVWGLLSALVVAQLGHRAKRLRQQLDDARQANGRLSAVLASLPPECLGSAAKASEAIGSPAFRSINCPFKEEEKN